MIHIWIALYPGIYGFLWFRFRATVVSHLKPVISFVGLRRQLIFRLVKFEVLGTLRGQKCIRRHESIPKNSLEPRATLHPPFMQGHQSDLVMKFLRFLFFTFFVNFEIHPWVEIGDGVPPNLRFSQKECIFGIIYFVRDYPENLSKKYSQRKKLDPKK